MDVLTTSQQLMRVPAREQTRAELLLRELAACRTTEGQLDPHRALSLMRELIEADEFPTVEPLLPLLLHLDNKPYTLVDHFPMSPMFTVNMASQIIYTTGRQTSKSTSEAASSIIRAATLPNFKQLYIAPLYEQVRRFSNLRVKPLIEQSPVRSLLVSTSTEKNVLQRSLRNGSLLLFSFALLDADRVRGYSSDSCSFDELQDLDKDHIPIITETMSYSTWRLTQFTGTPKTLDNTIARYQSRSSMAEWWIPCTHCTTNGKPTQNIPSLDYHLLEMIGPYRDDISDEEPGTICYRCRLPINPRFGRWVHRYPERRWDFAGYHVPQLLLPLHYSSPKRWAELLAKMEGGNIAPATFYNEVLGESYDTGTKLVSETDIQQAATLPWANNEKNPVEAIFKRLPHYVLRVLAIDWGGGGEDGVSFTTMALLGFQSSGKIDVLWGRRLYTPNDHLREAQVVWSTFRKFQPDLIAHDYTGAGTLRETFLVQAGVPLTRLMPIAYVGSASHNVMAHVPASPLHPRDHYRADKTRTLLYTAACIKRQYLRFFQDDFKDASNVGILRDFLNLIEEKVSSKLARDIYRIYGSGAGPDDFAQAVNLGCIACWHVQKAWPNFVKTDRYRLDSRQIAAAGDRDHGWENDPLFGVPGA